MVKRKCCLPKLTGLAIGRCAETEVILSQNRYTVMEYVSHQSKEYRFVDIYYLLKKLEPGRWDAKGIKTTLE